MKYGIYIHIPFCSHICHYCDYFVDKRINQIEQYTNALLKEIDMRCRHHSFHKQDAVSVYFGGGTPSLLSSQQFEKIITHLQKYFEFDKNIEITIESNPDSIEESKISEFQQIGLNRISLGVQSFIKAELGALRRNHSPKKAQEALNAIFASKIENVSLDLIFSIPNQSSESFAETLETAFSFPIKHISTYSLIYEPGTPLFKKWKKGIITKQSDENDAQFYQQAIDTITQKGMKHYEVSNFAYPDFECKHNLHSWHSEEYYAFGASSHGYINSQRYWNKRDLKFYYNQTALCELPEEGSEEISPEMQVFERIYLGIRADGISYSDYKRDFDTDLKMMIVDFIDKFKHLYLDSSDLDRLRLNSQGYMICDSLTLELIETFEKNSGLKFNPQD